jgi:hypothetical protein
LGNGSSLGDKVSSLFRKGGEMSAKLNAVKQSSMALHLAIEPVLPADDESPKGTQGRRGREHRRPRAAITLLAKRYFERCRLSYVDEAEHFEDDAA